MEEKYIKNIMKNKQMVVWIFPLALFVVLMLLSLFKISGSSIGIFPLTLNHGVQQDNNLLFGQSRGIRSDEWLVTSSLTLAQKNANFPYINKNIGEGQNMSVILDVPYREWSVLFKPQNLFFFFMPFEMAFAAKWWFLSFILAMSSYLLFLVLLPRKYLISSLLSLLVVLNPFVQWWYLATTIVPIASVFFSVALVIRILEAKTLAKRIILAIALAYCLVCLVVVLYIPFIIASSLVGLIILSGYLLSNKHLLKNIIKPEIFVPLVFSLGIALVISGIFIQTRYSVIQTVQQTAYPGQRVVFSGGYNISKLFSLYELPKLQNDIFALSHGLNQSEEASFLFLAPLLLMPALYLLVHKHSNRNGEPLLILTTIGTIIILARLYIPHTDVLFLPLFLNKVPHNRLLLSLGLLSIMQYVSIIRIIFIQKKIVPFKVVIASVCITIVYLIACYLVFYNSYKISTGILTTSAYTLLLIFTIFFLQSKKTVILSVVALLTLNVLFVYKINPLYVGMSIENNKTIETIKQINNIKSGVWVVNNSVMYEQFPQIANSRSISGLMSYPQLSIWKKIPNYSTYINTINRYAHIVFVFNNNADNSIHLIQGDSYSVNIDLCTEFAKENIDYILSTTLIESNCVNKVNDSIDLRQRFYIYSVNKDNI